MLCTGGTTRPLGVEMAIEELGETKYNYEFIAEDDVADPTNSVAAYQKLRSINDVDAIVGTYSPQGNALAPLAEEDQPLAEDVQTLDDRQTRVDHGRELAREHTEILDTNLGVEERQVDVHIL